jgi:hypothetical protein
MAFVNTDALEAAVKAWLDTEWAGAVTVIKAKQGGRPPASPYAIFELAGPVTRGGEHRGEITDPGAPAYASQAVAYHQQLSASINVYGTGAMDKARLALQGLSKTPIAEALRAAGLAPPHRRPEPRNLTGLVKTDFEERAQFDVIFALGDVFTDSLPLIETLEGEATLYNPDGTARDDAIAWSAP